MANRAQHGLRLLFSTDFEGVMAENETAVVEQQEEQDYQYQIKIEDAGPATKKVTVEIPKDRIDQVLTDQYKDLRQNAAIPGFRPGHAPQKLIEKRFASDVREQVRRTLISESYQQAVEKNSLSVIGEPAFDNPEAIQLKDNEGLSYSFQVEVQPEFTLPDVTGLKVKKPKIEVTDENVQQALQNLKEQQGTLVPVEDRGVQDKDYIIADVHIKLDGNVVSHQHDAQIISRPGRLGGIDVVDLDKQLAGAKPGETKTIKVHVADTHAAENLRGKDVEIEIAIKDIKKLEEAEINEEFLTDLGFSNQQELLDALREQMVERITFDVQQAMREQVNKFLLENTTIDLPTKLSENQADRVVNRRATDLMMRGLPREQIEANVERLRHGAREEAIRELKLFFILQKIATEQNVDVDEGQLNGRVAMIAAQQGQRPEKLKQQMAKDGTLANLYVTMREQKAVDVLLEKAQIEEVDLQTATEETKKSEKSE
jgi:trigger factor